MFKARTFLIAAALGGAGLIAACQEQPTQPPASAPAPSAEAEVQPAPAPVAAALPAVDTARAEAFTRPGNPLVTLDFPRDGDLTVKGAVTGYDAPVYAIPVAAGQTLEIAFQTTSTNLYINVSDVSDASGEAAHRGETDGPNATLKAERDTTFVVSPYQPRAMARRGESADFSLVVSRK